MIPNPLDGSRQWDLGKVLSWTKKVSNFDSVVSVHKNYQIFVDGIWPGDVNKVTKNFNRKYVVGVGERRVILYHLGPTL